MTNATHRPLLALCAALLIMGCTGDRQNLDNDATIVDTREDTGGQDTGGSDTGGSDTGGQDTGGSDAVEEVVVPDDLCANLPTFDTIELEEALPLFVKGFCIAQERCGETLALRVGAESLTAEDCERVINRLFFISESMLISVDQGTAIYNAGEFEACFRDLCTQSCSALRAADGPCARQLIRGTAALGETCFNSEECAGRDSECSVRNDGVCPGTCVSSNPCGDFPSCPASTYCDNQSNPPTCRTLVAEGESCDNGQRCERTLACFYDPQRQGSFCEPRRSEGDVCDRDDACQEGLSCLSPVGPDADRDGLSDALEEELGSDRFNTDSDGDGISDTEEAGSLEDPVDTDQDTIPDLLDEDSDGDGLVDARDNCRIAANSQQVDSDQDGAGDACDACPDDPNCGRARENGVDSCFDTEDNDGDGFTDCADSECFSFPECGYVPVCGVRGAGSPCQDDEECEGGLFCYQEQGSSGGTCAEIAFNLEEGAACRTEFDTCVWPNACIDGTCAPLKAPDEPCASPTECAGWCDGKVCQPYKTAGEPCTDGRECEFLCSADGVCVAERLSPGEDCRDNEECASGICRRVDGENLGSCLGACLRQ